MTKTATSITGLFAGLMAAMASAEAAHRPPDAAEAAAAVPEPLKPWIPWVLHGDGEEVRCPTLAGRDEGRTCAWPARLTLALADRGGTFTQEWEVWKRGDAELPGGEDHWPQDVRVDGKPWPVLGDDTPSVTLEPGHHVVSGRFAWETVPDALAAPAATGLLSLAIRGRRIDFPLRDEKGQVFLGRKEVPAETDSVEVTVYRRVIDDNPLRLVTRLQLAVSGKSRELVLGRALPAGFQAQSVDSPLPLRFDPDGYLRLQVRPGTWTLSVEARRIAPAADLTRPVPDGLWKEGDEVWVFDARPELRLCDVVGPRGIDPAQTTLPDDWKALPAYAMPPGATMTLVERRRGDGDTARDRLTLARRLWLDFDGGGYTASDHISGHFGAAWRLEAAAGTQLGRVSIDGRDQFITRLGPDGRDGVELRTGKADLSADSRIQGGRGTLPATGFQHDFDQVSAELAIPPGWRLFHASGADKITGTWIDGWSLMDFFLLLVTAVAAHRLFGWRLGLVALVGLALTITERGAPAAIWLAVLIAEAIARALPAGKLQSVARITRVAIWTVLIVLTVPYAVSEIRRGVHPATEHEPATYRSLKMVANQSTSAYAPAEMPQAPSSAEVGVLDKALGGRDSALDADVLGNLLKRRRDGEKPAAQNRDSYDPNAIVQTGPGVPDWSWSSATLAFNGPVARDQTLRLYLAPPWLNLLLSLARVALLALLATSILRRPLRLGGGGWHPARPLLGAALALLLMGSATARAAEVALPSPELLAELKKRLLEAPDCAPACGALSRMAVEASPGALRLVLEASAGAPTAIPLPGGGKDWAPASVRLDGKPAPALSRTDDGVLWLPLASGIHRVELEGPLPARDSVQLSLPLPPRFVSATARGWVVDGVHEDGAVDDSLKLSRQAGSAEQEEPSASVTLPPYLRVERTLHLGLRWKVDTVVRRETPSGTPVVVSVPLLPGEAPTTPGVRVDKKTGAVSVSLAPDADQATWHSTLAPAPALHLRADPAAATRWAETWRLDLGPTWHAELAGIPPVHQSDDDGPRVPTWRPWPGEEVTIGLARPAGAGGQSLTIDTASLVLAPSLRSSRATLTLEVRSSRGGQHAVTLAHGVELESVTVDGTTQPIRLERDGRRVVLPVAPGKHTFAIVWRDPTRLSARLRAPEVDLGVPSTNVTVQIDLSEAPRWVLWTAGPLLGPAVQFWSVVLVLLMLALALDRSRLTPLRWWDWTLLGLGLSQLPVAAAAVVGLFLLAVGWRARHPVGGRRLYDLSQLAMAMVAVASVAILFAAIEQGLVSQPDMRVVGNGSTSALLRWYQDGAAPLLPRPTVISAPLMVYRATTLLWSLWLALAGMGWARWVWRCARQHGWWSGQAAPAPVAPPSAPTGV
ncbi:MAG TPA: hypothetical protein VN962_16055 [Polyangia bacterium]|nr:hypothetical protein [Polyangia bacterium]